MAINAHEENLGQVLWDTNIYCVPPYQRNYSWDKDEITTLWNDLKRVTTSQDTYFLGSMVFVKTDSAMVFDVLDGQQRFASLLLMVAAFRELIRTKDAQSQSLNGIQQILVKVDVTGKFGNNDVVHVQLNHQDKEFFNSLIQTGVSPKPQHTSHKLLSKAFSEFKRLIATECESRSIDLEHLWAQLRDAATQRLFIIRITVDDYVNAQQVFQALNSAGMDLSQADLIKNYVLMEAGKANFDQALSFWLETTQTVGDANLTSFTRAFWNSNYTLVRTNDLYKKLSEVVKAYPDPRANQVGVLVFLKQLRDESSVYFALRNPDASYWGNTNAALLQDLSDLRDLNAQLVLVPLLAAKHALGDDLGKFAEVARWLLIFYIRHTVIGGRAANEVEELYSIWAAKLRTFKMSIEDLKTELIRLAPSDEQFEADLTNYSVARQKTAQILLARINDSVNIENVIRKTVTTGGTVHVEHIIPQQPEKWASFLTEQGIVHEEVVNKLGNLTLLLGSRNQEASNRTFENKLSVYKANGKPEPINEMLITLSAFGKSELQDRQKWLTARAMEIWKWN